MRRFVISDKADRIAVLGATVMAGAVMVSATVFVRKAEPWRATP